MKSSERLLYWLPRLLAIAAILFVSVFALDAFDPQLSLAGQILAFLIHLIPSFILVGILVWAWLRELSGGLVFLFLGLILSPVIFMLNYRMNHSVLASLQVILLITVPFIAIGGLFVWHHFIRRPR